MPSFQEYKRRSLIPLAGLGLAAYYLMVFVPLDRRADSLDEPLGRDWAKLTASLEQTNASSLDFRYITNQLKETRQALAILEDAKKSAAARLELGPALRAKLNAPFQLVDYQNERSKQMDELDRQAKAEKITIDPAVYSGFPEHTVDIQQPALLWAALSLTEDLLATALRCKVAAIHNLEVNLAVTNAPGADSAGRWAEIPVQLEFTASADNAARLIESLPLRAAEIRAVGLPESPPEKEPLLLDRLIIRKQSPEKLDEVRVWLRAVGFVLRD
jgi:hypothetical protein